MRLHGVFAPVSTPFDENGDVDASALQRNLHRYSRAGLDGFVIAGSTGEAASLNAEERLQLFATAREAADGKLLIAGAGVESVRETVRIISAAAALEYHAALVLTPHYYRAQMARPESQIAFFESVADASPLPVLIYDFPQMTGIDLPADVVARLAEHPNIVGMKESSADIAKVESLIAAVAPAFPILVGASHLFHQCLLLGAVGGVLGIANVAPRSTRLIYERYCAGDIQGSFDAQRAIADAAGVVRRYGIQGLKYAMDLKGYSGGPARPPLLRVDDREKSEIEALFRTVGE